MHRELNKDQLYVTVDLLIWTVRAGRLNLLLSRRVSPPYAGSWALPGRFIGLDESAETAVTRLLEEMLPVRGPYLEQLYTFTNVARDPRGRVISTASGPERAVSAAIPACSSTSLACSQATVSSSTTRTCRSWG